MAASEGEGRGSREMLRMILELGGHVVYDAADGVRGLELLGVVRPDVGIIDINLPRMDGYFAVWPGDDRL